MRASSTGHKARCAKYACAVGLLCLAASDRNMAGALAGLALARDARTPELVLEGLGFGIPRQLICVFVEGYRVFYLSDLLGPASERGLVMPDVATLTLKVS